MANTLHPWRRDPVNRRIVLLITVMVGMLFGLRAPDLFNVSAIVTLPVGWALASLFLGIFFEQGALRLAISFNLAGVAGLVLLIVANQKSRIWSEIWTVAGLVLFFLVPAIVVAYASLVPRLFRVYPMEDENDETGSNERRDNGEQASSHGEENRL